MAEKHILRIKNILGRSDSQKILYPNGLVSEIEEDDLSDPRPVKRIELFAKNERSNETFGIIRSFFVGFSFERRLLDLANFSDNVISVRAVRAPEYKEGKIVEDKLVLKRIESPDPHGVDRFSRYVFRRQKAPSLKVPSRWLDKTELRDGDRIIVSNTVENYVTPPPELEGAN